MALFNHRPAATPLSAPTPASPEPLPELDFLKEQEPKAASEALPEPDFLKEQAAPAAPAYEAAAPAVEFPAAPAFEAQAPAADIPAPVYEAPAVEAPSAPASLNTEQSSAPVLPVSSPANGAPPTLPVNTAPSSAPEGFSAGSQYKTLVLSTGSEPVISVRRSTSGFTARDMIRNREATGRTEYDAMRALMEQYPELN